MLEKNIWDFWANRYDRLWAQKYSLQPSRVLVLNELKKCLQAYELSDIKLLDVGCGTGQLMEEVFKNLDEWNLTLTGLDFSAKMIEMAKKKNLSNASFSIGDAVNLPFTKGQFDIITCCHSFPYYKDKVKALSELTRVLKPGGYLFLIQASENNFYDSLIMKFVKFTTSKATYPSAVRIGEMVKEVGATLVEQKRLETKFFIPSIILSIIQNGDKT